MALTTLVHDRSKVLLKWNKPTYSDFSHYIIKVAEIVNDVDVAWKDATTVVDNYDLTEDYIYSLPHSGRYKFMIKAVTNRGKESITPATILQDFVCEPTPLTTDLYPISTDPTDKTKLTVTWNYCEDLDFDHYEICYRLWDDSKKIVTKSNFINYTITDDNPHIFLVRAYNVGGFHTDDLVIRGTFKVEPIDLDSSITINRKSSDKRLFTFSWTPSKELDVTGYVAKLGLSTDDWNTDDSSLLNVGSTSTPSITFSIST